MKDRAMQALYLMALERTCYEDNSECKLVCV